MLHVAVVRLLTYALIVDHNLTGIDGRPLPVGEGLFEALGDWQIAAAIIDTISQHL